MGERGRGSITTTMNTVSLLVVLFAVAASAEDEVARKPKLFFVSTSVTTSILNTGSICYVSSTTIASCGRRKRRAINTDGKLFPKDAATTAGGREGRFLLYWITTTSISTSTSYTTTCSISSVVCTLADANLCG